MNLRFSLVTRTAQGLLALGIAAGAPACADDVSIQLGPGSASGTGGSGSAGTSGSGGAGGSGVTIDWGPCPSGFQTECASVPMPLDWSNPAGQEIPIFISRQRSGAPVAKAQMWFLQGGPGGSGDAFGPIIDRLTTALWDFDFYVLEHRGVGDSARLGCPAQESQASPDGPGISGAEWAPCVDSVKNEWAGGLAQFTTTGDSKDLMKLIELTRAPDQKVFVYGVSYGTTRALRFLQLDPPGIDGVILDSLVSPGVQYLSRFDEQFDPVAKALSDLCTADAICSGKLGPDPWAAVVSAIDKLKNNSCAALGQTGYYLKLYLPTYIRYRELRTHIFPLLYRVNRCDSGDVQVIQHYVNEVANLLSGASSGRSSRVLQNHVVLSELWEEPAPSVAELYSRCEMLYFCPSISADIGLLYDTWPRYPHEVFTGKWPSTTVPVLSMNGTLDPQTPIELAQAIQGHVNGPYQTFVSVPNSPHGVIAASPVQTGGPHCGLQMLIGFAKNPQAAVDTSCLSDLVPVTFSEDPAFVQMLFGTTDMWENMTPLQVPQKSPPGWDAFVENIRRTYRAKWF